MIGVLVSGTGTNLQALIDADLPIAAVASNRSDAAALERADAAGIPNRVFELDRYADREARDRELAEWLQLRGVELVVLAGYMHLLTPAFLDRFPDRIVNVHPSLLPEFPGARAIDDALARGEAVLLRTHGLREEAAPIPRPALEQRARECPFHVARLLVRQAAHRRAHRGVRGQGGPAQQLPGVRRRPGVPAPGHRPLPRGDSGGGAGLRPEAPPLRPAHRDGRGSRAQGDRQRGRSAAMKRISFGV